MKLVYFNPDGTITEYNYQGNVLYGLFSKTGKLLGSPYQHNQAEPLPPLYNYKNIHLDIQSIDIVGGLEPEIIYVENGDFFIRDTNNLYDYVNSLFNSDVLTSTSKLGFGFGYYDMEIFIHGKPDYAYDVGLEFIIETEGTIEIFDEAKRKDNKWIFKGFLEWLMIYPIIVDPKKYFENGCPPIILKINRFIGFEYNNYKFRISKYFEDIVYVLFIYPQKVGDMYRGSLAVHATNATNKNVVNLTKVCFNALLHDEEKTNNDFIDINYEDYIHNSINININKHPDLYSYTYIPKIFNLSTLKVGNAVLSSLNNYKFSNILKPDIPFVEILPNWKDKKHSKSREWLFYFPLNIMSVKEEDGKIKTLKFVFDKDLLVKHITQNKDNTTLTEYPILQYARFRTDYLNEDDINKIFTYEVESVASGINFNRTRVLIYYDDNEIDKEIEKNINESPDVFFFGWYIQLEQTKRLPSSVQAINNIKFYIFIDLENASDNPPETIYNYLDIYVYAIKGSKIVKLKRFKDIKDKFHFSDLEPVLSFSWEEIEELFPEGQYTYGIDEDKFKLDLLINGYYFGEYDIELSETYKIYDRIYALTKYLKFFMLLKPKEDLTTEQLSYLFKDINIGDSVSFRPHMKISVKMPRYCYIYQKDQLRYDPISSSYLYSYSQDYDINIPFDFYNQDTTLVDTVIPTSVYIGGTIFYYKAVKFGIDTSDYHNYFTYQLPFRVNEWEGIFFPYSYIENVAGLYFLYPDIQTTFGSGDV